MKPEEAHLSHEEAHHEIITIIIPLVSLITIFMFIGVIGNAAVIYIYGFKLKKSTVHYFITVLAVFDFICCLLGFPLEIIEVYYTLDYPSNGLCKWQRFLTFGCSIGSGTVLLLISIERYRKVCWPAKYQIKLCHAKYFTLGVCFFSVLMSIPISLMVSNEEIELNKFGNKTGYDCRREGGQDAGSQIYLIFLLIYTSTILATMVILYSLLCRTARKHFLESDTRYKQNSNNNEAESSPARRQQSRTNRTVISLTVLFIISFIPPLILGVFTEQLTSEMNYKEQIIFFTFLRLYIFNSSFNPIVYGFCNKYFRHSFVNLFRRIFGSSKEIQIFSIETSSDKL